MPKSSKRFILHTDSLNAQGFRMLTSGVDLSDFEKNPVLLFNHIRPSGNEKNQILPIGYWTDIELKDGEISAVPFFDDNDEFAMSIYHKVENGILKMCSAGAEPIETSNDPKVVLPGQKLETVTRWKMKEGSICDIGANPDALAVALYDDGNKIIALSESTIKNLPDNLKTPDMSKNRKDFGTPPKKVELKKLTDEEKAAQAKLEQEELEKQLAEGGEDEKDKEIASLKAKLNELEEKLKLAESDEEEPEVKAKKLADTALKMRKITLAEKPSIIKLATADYDATLEMLQARKATTSVKETLELTDKAGEGEQARIVELSKKSYDELFNSGDLQFLKLNAPDVYKAKFKSKFGKEPQAL